MTLETAINSYNKVNYPYGSITFIQSVPTAIEAIRKVRQQLGSVKKGLEAGLGSNI